MLACLWRWRSVAATSYGCRSPSDSVASTASASGFDRPFLSTNKYPVKDIHCRISARQAEVAAPGRAIAADRDHRVAGPTGTATAPVSTRVDPGERIDRLEADQIVLDVVGRAALRERLAASPGGLSVAP